MTNALYNPGREGFLLGDLDWDGSTPVKVLLLDSSYSFNATHKFLSDISGGAIIATSPALTSRTGVNGIADAATVVVPAVASGRTVAAMVLFFDTGTGSTSRLIGFIDTATNLPLPTDGGPINITWDTGANKIFKL